jgi:hypothetical protein
MVGQTVNQYEFVEKIGAGGMGEIYKAHDTKLNRFVAVKVLPPGKSGDKDRRRRFVQEAQAASALNHPNIITIHDIVADGDVLYIIMEYIPGQTLHDLIPTGGLRVPHVLQYATQMADALSTAHAAGIIHRDFKPANVMVTTSGRVKVLDFGLAKLTDRSGQFNTTTSLQAPAAEPVTVTSASFTMEGSIMGTVNYMSPEQAEGKKVDARSDIFSFGSVLYEMVTGRRAFEGDSGISTMSAVLRDDVKPIGDVAADVPQELEDIIMRCLRKLPDARWPTMKEVETALVQVKRRSDSGALYRPQIATTSLPPPTQVASEPAAQKVGRSRDLIFGGVILFVIAAAAGGGWWWVKQRQPGPQPPAQVVTKAVEAPPPAPIPAEQQAPAVTPPANDGAMTNDSILDMVQAKVQVPVILGQIHSSKTNFNLSTEEVIRLSKAGVPAQIIEAMRNPKAVVNSNSPGNATATNSTSVKPPAVQPGAPNTKPLVPSSPVPGSSPQSASTAASSTGNPPGRSAPPPAPAVKEIPRVPSAATPVTVSDGLPFRIFLVGDVRADSPVDQSITFTVADGLQVEGATVIPKGATAIGSVVGESGKKVLGMGGGAKLRFHLISVDAVDGQKLKVRALPVRRAADGLVARRFETIRGPRNKELAAENGTEYIGYIDGEQVITVRK